MMNQLSQNKAQLLFWCTLLMIVSIETKKDSRDLVTLVSSLKAGGRQAICPGEEITLTCSIQNTEFLQWSWGYAVENRIIFTDVSKANFNYQGFNATRTKVQNTNDNGIANLESTLTFRASDHLNGTTINCSGSSLSSKASYLILYVYVVAPPPPPSVISHKLICMYSNYSVFVIEWAAVPEAKSYKVNMTRADMKGGSTSQVTSMNILSFIAPSTDTTINFSIRASNCLGYGDAHILSVNLSQLDNTSMSDPEGSKSPALIPILSTLCGVFGVVLGTLMIVFIITKLMSRGLEVKQCSKESPGSDLPSSNKLNGMEYSEARDSSGNWHTNRGQTRKSSKDTDTYSRPRDYINWIQLHTTTASAPHRQPSYEEIDCTEEPQKNFRLLSSRCEMQEAPMHQETQSGMLTASGNACMNNTYKQDQATTSEEKQELKISHRQLSSRYEMHELPDFRILEQSSERQAVGGGYTEEQKRRLEYSDLNRNSMYFSLQPCVQKKPPTVPPEPTSENRYSSLHHEY